MKPRRKTIKHKIQEKLVLERKTLSKHQVLTLNRKLCIGCEICEKICPEKAVTKLLPATIHNGRLVKKGMIDIDADKCTFCGECVVLCPLNAIKIEINGEERIPVVEAKAFPILTKEIEVDVSKCGSTCNLACQESCPTEAIQVIMEKVEPLGEQKIVEVKVDKKMCVFCKHCELACPKGAIHVIKPIRGFTQLNTNLCPKDCEVCVDICPSKAVNLGENGKPAIIGEFCIYCGACQEVCPEKAINVRRVSILHSEVKSGAWNEALEKLTSYNSLVKELNIKCKKKAYIRVGTYVREGSKMSEAGGRKFIFADPAKCTGCGACELVCALEKENKFKPSLSRIKVNRLFGILNFVSVCRFCEDAPCVAVCPTNALTQSKETGVILVESEKCNGCGWCIQACDYGAVALHPEATSVLICDLCGGEPKCVEWCPEDALELASANEQNNILLFTLTGKLIKGSEGYGLS